MTTTILNLQKQFYTLSLFSNTKISSKSKTRFRPYQERKRLETNISGTPIYIPRLLRLCSRFHNRIHSWSYLHCANFLTHWYPPSNFFRVPWPFLFLLLALLSKFQFQTLNQQLLLNLVGRHILRSRQKGLLQCLQHLTVEETWWVRQYHQRCTVRKNMCVTGGTYE